ncbi:MAG: VOC family protein [Steroidobacteraceae bacterium]
MPGRFLELSVATDDIRASVEFYERLGFTQCETGDTWTHPYGALTDGRFVIGLHAYRFASPSLTFVRAGIARHIDALEAAGAEIAFRRTGEDVFNEVGFRDTTGHMVTVLEARTFSPPARGRDEPSLCGDFVEYSLPARDFAAARHQWEAFGFVAVAADGGVDARDDPSSPWRRLSLTSDHLNLALHVPRFFAQPLLVFGGFDAQRRARLEARGLSPSADLPPALDPARHALVASPEGLAILLTPD